MFYGCIPHCSTFLSEGNTHMISKLQKATRGGPNHTIINHIDNKNYLGNPNGKAKFW
jgi:hypothetical protein